MSLTDEAILDLYHEGSREKAFSQLVEKYRQQLYFHIRRIVTDHHYADDVLQNTFLKAWKGLDNFRADAMLYTWLYRIATNEALQFLKKQPAPTDEGKDLHEKLKADPYFEASDIQLKLQTAIDALPEKQKLVFIMRYYDELKYEQIAEVLDTSVGGLKASYHHAVKKIEEALKK